MTSLELEQRVNEPHGHHKPCGLCGEPCNSFAGNPGLWPLYLGNDLRWCHTGCVRQRMNRADRMLVALRRPGEELMTAVITEMCRGDINCPTAGSALRTAADWLDRKVE